MDVKKKVLLAIIAYSLFPNASLSCIALTSDINQSKVTSQKVKTHLKRNQNSSNEVGVIIKDGKEYVIVGESKGSTSKRVPSKKLVKLAKWPEFPGGTEGLISYLQSNVIYPFDAIKEKIEVRVIVLFTVEPDGTLKNIQVETPVSPLLDEEAVRVVKSMPKWIPALTTEGKTARVKYSIPIVFKL